MRDPVVILGGTRGTGRLIAGLLAARRDAVRVVARNPERVDMRLRTVAEVMQGDITEKASLWPVLFGARHIIFTAGIRSGRPSLEGPVKTTEYDGVVNVLDVARDAGFDGRILYMTASGGTTPNLAASFLNLYKGKTLVWRRRAEGAIRASGLDYTIVRAGMLLDRPGGRRAILLTQRNLPLSPRYRIARADVAQLYVAALEHPCASRTTFDVAWTEGPRREPWSALLDRLYPDAG